MSHTAHIGELFAALGQTGSLEAALSDSVRLACEAAGCLAGAVVADLDETCLADPWFRHDPHGLIEQLTSDGATLEAPTAGGHDRNGAMSCAAGVVHQVRVPLSCAGRDVGWLILLAPQEVGEEPSRRRIAGIDAVLAVLMAVMEISAAKPLSSVLSREGFRARVVSEISWSERCGNELSVLHVIVPGLRERTGDEMTSPWASVALLGETLAPRLRRSDVVGLMGPDHLAVLLTATGRLGARIAARRIGQLLRMPEDDSSSRLDLSLVAPEFCLKTFPDDGGDADRLCCVQRWRAGARVSAAQGMTLR